MPQKNFPQGLKGPLRATRDYPLSERDVTARKKFVLILEDEHGEWMDCQEFPLPLTLPVTITLYAQLANAVNKMLRHNGIRQDVTNVVAQDARRNHG